MSSSDTVVEVYGGVVQHVHNVDEYVVIDWDDLKEGEISVSDIDEKIGLIAGTEFDDEEAKATMLNQLIEVRAEKVANFNG